MYASCFKSPKRWFTVVAFGALVLTGCGGEDVAKPAADSPTSGASAPAATPSDSGQEPAAATTAPADDTTTPSDGGEGAKETPASTGGAAWAGTKQFVQIDKAWTEGGTTYLSVRPAQKKIIAQFDTWQLVPGKGPYTTVPMAKDARILLTVQVRGEDPSGAGRAEPVASSQADFVSALTKLDPRLRAGVGYDLSFDGEGRVVKLQSAYRA